MILHIAGTESKNLIIQGLREGNDATEAKQCVHRS